MSKPKGNVLLNAVVYTFSGLLLKCFSFFLLPLYTAYLTTTDYGITSVISGLTGVLGFVVAFSLYSAVNRFYVEYKDDPEKLKRFYGTVSLFVFISCIIWLCVFVIFRDLVATFITPGVDFWPYVFLGLISLIFHTQHTIYTTILGSQQKALKSSLLSICFAILSLLLNILFVVVLKKGAAGVLLSTVIAEGVFFAIYMVDMLRMKAIAICLDGKLLRSALKYSLPIMPHNLSTHIAVFVSKILIGDTASVASLGVYTVAAQFGNVADTIQSRVDSAYGPWLYEQLHGNALESKNTIRSHVRLLIELIGLAFLGITLFSHDYVVLLVNHEYVMAWRYIPLIVGVYAIKTMYYFYVEVLFYYKKASRMLFVATLSGSLLNILLSAFMIPAWGVYGSILADACAMTLRVGVVVLMSRRFADVGIRLGDFLGNLAVLAVFMLVGALPSYLWWPETFDWRNLLIKVAVVLLYVGKLYWNHGKQVNAAIKRFLRKKTI